MRDTYTTGLICFAAQVGQRLHTDEDRFFDLIGDQNKAAAIIRDCFENGLTTAEAVSRICLIGLRKGETI